MKYVDEQKIICVGEYHTKKVATKLIKLFLFYVLAIIYLVNGINEYNAVENWKSITIMTEMMKFETSLHPIRELYMIYEFDIGILVLFETLLMSILFIRELKCKIAITNKGIHGITYWRREIYIPFKSIQSVYIKKNKSCICIETSSKVYKFTYIENCLLIYEILSGNLKRENIVSLSRLNEKENKDLSKNRNIWIRILVAIAIFLIGLLFVKSN